MDHSDLVQQLTLWIDDNIFRKIRIDDVVRYSKWYLQRIFKEYRRIALATYIRQQRLLNAKGLLVSTKEPIMDIAFRCGFDSLHSFSRIFSREFGISPSRWRECQGQKTRL